jgi:hypothetical protein
MKKWSIISSLVVIGALAIAALATAGPASAGNPYEPHCQPGELGTPPYCHQLPGGGGGEIPKVCPSGQVGTYPNCVVPALRIKKVKLTNARVVVTVLVNAPGTLVARGKGLASSHPRTVSGGSYKLGAHLQKGKRQQLRKTGKVAVTIAILYRPNGAAPIEKSLEVSFKGKKVNHHRHHKNHGNHTRHKH